MINFQILVHCFISVLFISDRYEEKLNYFVNILRPFVVDTLRPNQPYRPQEERQYDILDHPFVHYLP